MYKYVKNGIIAKYQLLREKFRKWYEIEFISAEKPLYWLSMLMFCWLITEEVGLIIGPEWLNDVCLFIGSLLVAILVRFIVVGLVNRLIKRNISSLVSIALILVVILAVTTYGFYTAGEYKAVITGIVIGCVVALLVKVVWSMLKGKRYTKFNIVMSLVCLVITGGSIWFFVGKGYEDTYIKTYLGLDKTQKQLSLAMQQDFEDKIMGGDYTVVTYDYGIDNEAIKTGTVNLSSFAQNTGVRGKIKEAYQGYRLNEVPLRGKIWYPEEINDCPTLFINHGNHTYVEESYLGYDYLGEYLASYGYVVVSVDQNSCNTLSNENDARAILLLENMKALQKCNEDEMSPLYQKMDYSSLAIAGHSRGGETVSIAYLFNELDVNPNNGVRRFNYDFDIKSLIAIAPTSDQYKPTGRSTVLEDVNYLLLHGANDQDVRDYQGIRQYKNIHFTGKGEYIKSALYCAGCNHGQFNRRWGLYDTSGIGRWAVNVENFISQPDQEEIAKIFIKIYLDCTLKQDTTHELLLEDYELYKQYLPETLYIQSYEKSDTQILCDFEEDLSLDTGSKQGVAVKATGVNVWTEGNYPAEVQQANTGVYLSWHEQSHPTLKITMPQTNLTNKSIQFDIMNLMEGFKEQDAKLLEAQIILQDANGQKASVALSDFATTYPSFIVRYNKLQYLFNEIAYKQQFQTVTIPVSRFINNKNIDMTQIVGLNIAFDEREGTVVIDEIGYNNNKN